MHRAVASVTTVAATISFFRKALAPLLLAGVLAGCATIQTTVQDPRLPAGDGPVYWLPTKLIQVTLKREEKKADEISVGVGAAHPDYRRRFVLGTDKAFGASHLAVTLNSRGLLGSINADSTNTLSDVLKNVAATLGSVRAVRSFFEAAQTCPDGEFTILIDPSPILADKKEFLEEQLCDFQVVVEPGFPHKPIRDAVLAESGEGNRPAVGETYDGVFYRLDFPYKVLVTPRPAEQAGIEPHKAGARSPKTREFEVSSPAGSPAFFMPVKGALLASNVVKLTLSDGVLTASDENKENEIAAAISLPADLVGAYFAAVGKMFDSRKDAKVSQQAYLEALNNVTKESLKNQYCKEAITAGRPLVEIKQACGVQ